MQDGQSQSHPLDDNLGLLYFLAKRYRVNGRFARWDEDELVGEFYVIARRAYDRRFDANKRFSFSVSYTGLDSRCLLQIQAYARCSTQKDRRQEQMDTTRKRFH